jgi:16S rRNA processing protein RimM
MSDEPVIVGHIRRSRGLGGEVVVEPASDVAGRFPALESALVVGGRGAPGPGIERVVETVRQIGNSYLLKFAGVNDPEAARELLVGHSLAVPRRSVPPAGGDESYHFELIGLAVVRTDGPAVGTLVEILETGANDVYVIRGPGGEVLIPATREVIERVDVEEGKVWVRPWPGLFDGAEEVAP